MPSPVRLRHWHHPNANSPWWVFGLRLGFWLLIGVGVQTATAGDGWHPDTPAAALGVIDLSWHARGKLRARRAPEPLASTAGARTHT